MVGFVFLFFSHIFVFFFFFFEDGEDSQYLLFLVLCK